jgi:F-type H+-transporting ATPase subunit beta
VAEPYSHIPAQSVAIEQTVVGCQSILEGELDDAPEESLWYIGGIQTERNRRRLTERPKSAL